MEPDLTLEPDSSPAGAGPGPTGDQRGAATVRLLGVRLDNLSESEVVDHVVRAAAAGRGGWMVNPNVDVMRQIVTDQALRQLVSGADLVVADGMPLLWAAALQGSPLKQRVPVSEAIEPICQAAAELDVGVFLLGGSPGTAQRAAEVLRHRYPGLRVGYLCPPLGFEQDEAGMAEVDRAIGAAAPGVVFCAFGFPKQERLMVMWRQRFPSIWFIGSGGTFSMVAGDTPKAPPWMRKTGLEWAHRLRLEPRRLFQRYIVHDVPFALRLLAYSGLARLAAPRTPPDQGEPAPRRPVTGP